MKLYTGGGRDPSHTTNTNARNPCSPIVGQRHAGGPFRCEDPRSDWLALPRKSHPHAPMSFLQEITPSRRSGKSGCLWKEYFTDLWDKRQGKRNPRSSDLKLLWIDSWYNPGRAKNMFETMPKASLCQAQDRDLVEQCAKAGAQELPLWETLSLESALASMERTAQPPSVQDLSCILHKCRTKKSLTYTKRLYAYLCKNGLEDHRSLGNYLVLMLVQVGSMCSAQQAFNKLVHRDVYSWTSLIWGYIELGDSKHALNFYQKMQEDAIYPSYYTFVVVLKACARLKNAERGREIHGEIVRKGLERDLFVGSTVVDMYSKCGSLAEAQEVFDMLRVRNQVSWTALMAGYAEHGLGEKALDCLEQMQLEGRSPDAVTVVCSLKACGSIGAMGKGQELYAEIARKGLERNFVIGSTLVDMYAKCGLLAEAQEAFGKLSVRDVVSWNVLVTGYAEQGFCEEALDCLKQMQLEGLSPNAVTFVCSLKACGSIGLIDKGREIHAEIVTKGLENDLVIGNTLVDMYAKCGSLVEAWELFDKLPVHNVVSWTALMAAYAEHGLGEEALKCFDQMQLEGLSPNAVTIICSLKTCGSIGILYKGREIYAEIARKGLETDLVICSTLVDMYAKCDSLAEAREVFDNLPVQNKVSWNALIAGYAEHGLGVEALNCFEQMQLEGFSANAVTLVFSLKACGSIGAMDKGREIHAKISRNGLERDLVVGNTLLDMYAKCGLLAEAQEVFDRLPVRNEVSWTALIAGFSEQGLGEEALECYEQMPREGLSPDAVTCVCSLKACASIGSLDKGREMHVEIAKKGLERDSLVGSTLVDFYAKCGSLAEARETFSKLSVRSEVSWNVLIAGYAKHRLGDEALNCLEQMQLEGLSPDAVTFVYSLQACGSIGAILKGREIHTGILRNGLERDLVIGNTLVDMYAKSGSLAEAREAFDKLLLRDVLSWTALIAGYAQQGECEIVFHMLERMREEGIKPNGVTFSLILCSHTGLVDKGQNIFESMSRDYGITPTIEHHICMVDLLGRAGQLDQALATVKKMPFHPDLAAWHTVLGACRKWGNVELGRLAFEHAVQLDEKDVASYILMCNIYTNAHLQEGELRQHE